MFDILGCCIAFCRRSQAERALIFTQESNILLTRCVVDSSRGGRLTGDLWCNKKAIKQKSGNSWKLFMIEILKTFKLFMF